MLRPWKLNLSVNISQRSRTAVYVQISHAIAEQIRSGRLAPGDALPGTRDLAEEIGVNRKTIIAAFDELVAQGWLTSDGTRGTFVSAKLPVVPVRQAPQSPQPAPSRMDLPDYTLTERRPELTVLLPQAGVLLFDDGAPDTRLFPVESLSREYRTAILRSGRRNALGYGDPRGSATLRRALSRMLNSDRGLSTTADSICLTRGSQMAIHLSARVLLRPGDCVVMEELSYPPAREVFRAAGAKIVAVPMDADGLDIAAVERVCRRQTVRLIYLTPHHQFPTTCVLRPDRRMRLLALAEQFRFAVVEDDYDHEFHFAHQPLLPLASVDPRKVIYIGSMSKLLTPSIRLGYLVAPPRVVERFAAEILLLDRQGDPATELAVAGMIDAGDVHRHARKSLQIYGKRRALFTELLRDNLLPFADFKVPEGGLAFWLWLKDTVDLERLDRHAQLEGVGFLPPASFRVADTLPGNGLRLGFASLNEAELREAIRRLGAALGSSQQAGAPWQAPVAHPGTAPANRMG
jgi:GntR family transcriptional regulator/MocR family aminotransferase